MPSIQATAGKPRTSQSAGRPASAIVVHPKCQGRLAEEDLRRFARVVVVEDMSAGAADTAEDMSAAAVDAAEVSAAAVAVVVAVGAAVGAVRISASSKT